MYYQPTIKLQHNYLANIDKCPAEICVALSYFKYIIFIRAP